MLLSFDVTNIQSFNVTMDNIAFINTFFVNILMFQKLKLVGVNKRATINLFKIIRCQ